MIYSFDGGTKNSYEKMRPGRFQKNDFNSIYENIKKFSELKKEFNSKFPRTKIQMVLTEDTFNEQDEYFSLFKDIVDDVSVKQYTERGGKLSEVSNEYLRAACSDDNIENSSKSLNTDGFDTNSEVMKDSDGNLFVSKEDLSCEQLYQRLLVTFMTEELVCVVMTGEVCIPLDM